MTKARAIHWAAFAGLLAALPTLAAQVQIPASQPGHPSELPSIPAAEQPSVASYRAMEQEVGAALRQELSLWFPRCVDREHGGFVADFAHDWSIAPTTKRTIVFESRMTWTAAAAMSVDPEAARNLRPLVTHGLNYLQTFWDKDRGGFLWTLAEDGRPVPGPGSDKHVYGNAFAIYAAAQAYAATKDPAALELARRGFAWLDAHAHDAANGGYWEVLTPEGQPKLVGSDGRITDQIGTLYGLKSMNTHIHVMEALNVLYQQQPDPQLRARLEEVFHLVRDRIAVEPGCLNLFFTPDWRPVPYPNSYGHDVETAYLLMEAAETLGLAEEAKTLAVARALVDHALKYGWDELYGGFYDEGPAFRDATDLARVSTKKIWWPQAEGLNALLLMHERYGRETDRYWNAAQKQWQFLREHQIDAQYGGWWPEVARDGAADAKQLKGYNWKAAYHTTRALLLSCERLQKLAGDGQR